MIAHAANCDSPTLAVEQHLREYAGRYFEEFDRRPVEVRLVNEQIRPASRFYRYHVSAGESQHSVLIKMPPPNAHSQPPMEQAGDMSDRPRMTSTTDATIKHLLEYRALVAIQCYFERLADRRFGTVKPLTYLPDLSALLMEEVKTPNLNTLFGRTNRLQGPLSSLDLRDAFCNAGAWLRYYHTLPKDHDVQVRHATRDAYTDSITKYMSYLGRVLHKENFLHKMGTTTIAQAKRVLPPALPLGLGHGDYAMRNILVSADNRVTVIDTLSRWRVPIYEDIGYFLLRLKANRMQVFSLGCAMNPELTAEYERQFLDGYFGNERVPIEAVRLFEIQALLDNWAAQVAAYQRKARTRRITALHKVQIGLVNRYYTRLLPSYNKP